MSIFSTIASAATSAPSLSLAPSSQAGASSSLSSSFGNTLAGALSHVNTLQNQAASMAQNFAVGKTSDIQGVMIAAEKATIALQLTTQVRNKAVQAYQQIMQISM